MNQVSYILDHASRPLPPAAGSAGDLQSALENELSRYYGWTRTIVEFEHRPSEYRSSYALEDLDLALDDGTRLQLVFKDLSTLLEPARRAKPGFLFNPLREIETYREILSPDRMGTAVCYGDWREPARKRYWLFLEKVPGLELYQIGSLSVWQRAAMWLAEMHAAPTPMLKSAERCASLLRYDADFCRTWIERAAEQLVRSDAARWVEQLAGKYDRVTSRLSQLPATFIHGEFYASNVLVQDREGDLRICPVDWEMAGIGPGLMDLAALIAGNWSEELKAVLAVSYHTALQDAGAPVQSLDEFLTDLDYCRLQLAVQWLGWSPEWTPPPEHSQDWLKEAMMIAARLGL